MTDKLTLNGAWTRAVGGRDTDFINVPGGFAPLGECELYRTFDLPWPAGAGERVFLVTDGVTGRVEFTVNGEPLGIAGGWAPYRFDIPPRLLKPVGNVMRAKIRDILEDFGVMPGRRFEAGLIRDLWIEKRPAAWLESFTFHAELNATCDCADCTVTVEINGQTTKPVELVLTEKTTGREIVRAPVTTDRPARFTVERPWLWSPATPELYLLTATLAGATPDVLTEQVGFRKLEAREHDFYLNGRRLFLKGVCRHEFTPEAGYSPTPAEVRRELAMIKHAGFNYIRLVHSPQAPCVCRLAAEVGILVSEEPGTCWHDLGQPAIAAPAIDCLVRIVRRDRNVPSVFAFLIYNECNPDTDYAVRMAKACREVCPGALLGVADCTGKFDEVKAMVAAADLSFYGINRYSHNPNDICDIMQTLSDRPLVITEWGGNCGQGNARVLKDLCDMFVVHSRPTESLRVAGCAFWAWCDYPEYSRSLPAAVDGWTIEGLTDRRGEWKPDLQVLSRMCFEMDNPSVLRPPCVEVLAQAPRRPQLWLPVPLDAVAGDQAVLEEKVDAWRRSRTIAANIRQDQQPWPRPHFGRRLVDGIEFLCRDAAAPAYPLLLGAGRPELVIPVNRRVRALAILGQVTALAGYPCSTSSSVFHPDQEPAKAPGVVAAEYEFVFDDGATRMPLRYGYEVARGNDICRWWMTAPRTANTRPALRVIMHPSFEFLRVDIWEERFPAPVYLREIRWHLRDNDALLALYALSVEPAE